MDLNLESDFWLIFWMATGIGAVAGLVYDLTEPVLRRGQKPSKDADFGDNSVRVPWLGKPGAVVHFGFLGRAIVGAVAAVIVVFLLATTTAETPVPVNEAAVKQELEDKGLSKERIEELGIDGKTGRFVRREQLIWVALVAGASAPLVLRTSRRRLSTLITAVEENAREAGGATGAAAALAAQKKGVEDSNELMQIGQEAARKSAQPVRE